MPSRIRKKGELFAAVNAQKMAVKNSRILNKFR
jgi:hypothetical protein